MDSKRTKRIYKGLKKVICDKWSLTKFRSYTKCFVLFKWCNKWKRKNWKNKRKLFKQVRNKKCQLKHLILEILAVVMDQKIDKGLQEQTKKKFKKKRNKKKRVEEVERLTRYFKKKNGEDWKFFEWWKKFDGY